MEGKKMEHEQAEQEKAEQEAISVLCSLSSTLAKNLLNPIKTKPTHNISKKKVIIKPPPHVAVMTEEKYSPSAPPSQNSNKINNKQMKDIINEKMKSTTEEVSLEEDSVASPQPRHNHNLRPRRKRITSRENENFGIKISERPKKRAKKTKNGSNAQLEAKKSKSQEENQPSINSKNNRNELLHKLANLENGGEMLYKIAKLEQELQNQKEMYDEMNKQLKTHTEAIQGLMQVVSTPQNLTNFQHQYAYQQLPNAQQHNQQVQYMPIYAYPPQMYFSPVPMNYQQGGTTNPPTPTNNSGSTEAPREEAGETVVKAESVEQHPESFTSPNESEASTDQ